jgi:hypothetical protein
MVNERDTPHSPPVRHRARPENLDSASNTVRRPHHEAGSLLVTIIIKTYHANQLEDASFGKSFQVLVRISLVVSRHHNQRNAG